MNSRWKGFVFVILGALGAVGFPTGPRERNEHNAHDLSEPEADFRGCDRDWDSITGSTDVSLQTPTSAADFRTNDRD